MQNKRTDTVPLASFPNESVRPLIIGRSISNFKEDVANTAGRHIPEGCTGLLLSSVLRQFLLAISKLYLLE